MHIQRIKSKQGNRTYEQILLRESYREPGGKRSAVKKRTLLNLTKYSPKIIKAFELVLKHKGDLSVLSSMGDIQLEQGPSVGAIFALFQVARKLGIEKALGTGQQGKLALWQVIARAHSQGSRLSAVRLAKATGGADILGFKKGFCEDNLYDNLSWLTDNQEKIEQRLFEARRGQGKPELFLYDVTSSYLEGEHNELADWGYNRDKKRGKKQIVIGLLCDEFGDPVSVQVFEGNTGDLKTFSDQVQKVVQRFGSQRVTFVGDRGMIKSAQIEELSQAGFHFITAITKPQIRSMIKKGHFQLELFEDRICEVQHNGARYILRRNPYRAEEMAASRAARLAALQALADEQNRYLAEHPRADDFVAYKKVAEKESRLKLGSFTTVTASGRHIHVEVDTEQMNAQAELDGCYVLKTDLPVQAADKQFVHDRYKHLEMVETAFRTSKTGHLELRPIYVRKAQSTRGHALVVMLAYLIVRTLKLAWKQFDLTVEEGLRELERVCAMKVMIKDGESCLRIPEPSPLAKKLLEAIDVKLPSVLPASKVNVDTKVKLPERRKK